MVGRTLAKGVRLFCESDSGKGVIVIDDVGHFAANALKAEFEKDPSFIKFLEIVSSGAAKIRQTNFAWALPPKIRTKGRFQSITSVAHWACEIIEILKVEPQNKLHEAFGGLLEVQEFLTQFCNACAIVEQFLRIMKTQGLNNKTKTQSGKLLSSLEKKSPVRSRLNDWLKKNQAIQLQLKH